MKNYNICFSNKTELERAENMLSRSEPNKMVYTIWGIRSFTDSLFSEANGIYLNLIKFRVSYPTQKQIDKLKKIYSNGIVKINNEPMKLSDVVEIFKQQEEGLVNIRLVDLSNRKIGKTNEETFKGIFDDDFGKGEI